MTDDEQAEAVVNGLADYVIFPCSCGKLHTVPKPSQDRGIMHEELGLSCGCGLEWDGIRQFDKDDRSYWVWVFYDGHRF